MDRTSEYVAMAVNDAKHFIETAVLPPNPKDPANAHLTWRLRPSQLRAIAMQEYLEPPAPWGLKVNLANLSIGPSHCNTIAKALILNHTVTSLDLSCCDMETEACVHLFQCIGRNSTLRHLNINGNFIEAPGAVAAAGCINRLETLHMACNRLGDKGCIAIAEALPSSSTIKFLNVRGNGATKFGVFKLLEALDPNIIAKFSPELKDAMAVAQKEYKKELQVELSGSTKKSLTNTPASPTTNESLTGSQSQPKRLGGLGGSVAEERTASDRRMSIRRAAPPLTAAAAVGESTTAAAGRSPTPVGASTTPGNSSITALWVQANLDIPQEMIDHLTSIMAARFPPPPEGFGNKKSKKGKKK